MPIAITVPAGEVFDEVNEKFIEIPTDKTLYMEYSLLAISKWESKFHKPYLTEEPKSNEETLYFLECMTTNYDVEPYVFKCIPNDEMKRIQDYIKDPMTGTTVKDPPTKKPLKPEVQSAELIYYYMFKLGIPKECEKWHFNKLTTLMRVFGVKDQQPDKLSRSEMIARNKAINARNRAKFHTKG